MVAYWMMFLLFAGGSFGKLRTTTFSPRNAPLFAVAMVLLALFIGLRYKVGGDWIPYQQMYLGIRDMSWGEVVALGDPGYMLLNRLSGAIGGGVWFVNLVCALIFTWGLARFADDQPNPWLAIAVAVPYLAIVVAMGYTRQAVAIGLMMAAIPAFQQHRYVRFFIYILLGATFHRTIIVVLPLIALSSLRHRAIIYATAAAMAVMMFLFFIDTVLSGLLRNYVEGNMKSDGAGTRIAMNVVAAAIFLPLQRYFVRTREEKALWRNFALAALLTLAGLFLTSSSTVVDRISLYLIPFQIFVLSRLPTAFHKNGRPDRLFTFLVLLYSAVVLGVWLNFASHADNWVPYQTFLLKQ